MPHSALALKLRAGVIESELDLQVRLAYMQGYAAIHAHPRAEITEAFREFGLLYGDAQASIPYMTGGKGGAELLDDERMRFAKTFMAMQPKEQAGYKPRAPGLKPVKLNSKKKK